MPVWLELLLRRTLVLQRERRRFPSATMPNPRAALPLLARNVEQRLADGKQVSHIPPPRRPSSEPTGGLAAES